jgi:hypothetical protein
MEPTTKPISHKDKIEEEMNKHYADLENFFGQNIFALQKADQENLYKEKVAEKSIAAEKPDFLSIRMTLESKIRILERKLEKDPDDEEISDQISALLKEDTALDNLYKLRNA